MVYPTAVWDGDTENRDPGQRKSPNWQDWGVLVQEIAGTQTELDNVKAGSVDMTDLVVDKTGMVQVGEFATGAATTAALNFSEAMDVNSDNYLSVVQAYGASAVDLTSAYNCTVGRFRHVMYNATPLTVAHETYGVTGQVVARNATLDHLHGGVLGTLEGHTTPVTLGNASGYALAHAGVIARVGGHAAITATSPLCGFLAFNNATAALASGIQVAYGATARSGSYPWDALLASDKCDVVLYTPTATDYEGGVKAVAGTAPSGTVTHFVKIRVGAATYAYIPAYTADTAT